MAWHDELTGADAIHEIMYVQSGDPGAVGAFKFWLDITGGASLETGAILKQRNSSNTGWTTRATFGTAAALASDTDGTLAANSDLRIATQKAVRTAINAAVAGLSWKQAVRAATTSAHTLATDYENGDTIDGVVLATGDRILIKNQASGSENGIYVVAASGAPARATDADSGAELVNASVYVSEGTVNADTQWTCTTNAPITVNSTSLAFAQLTSGGATTLDGLSDVVITAVVDGDTLVYDSASGHWVNASAGGGVTLAGLSDVDAPTPSDGDTLQYNTTTSKWENVSTGGTAPTSPTTTNLVRWYKADAGVTSSSSRVSAWADQSSAGSNLSQATSGNQPLLTASVLDGLPGLYFDSARSDQFPLDLSFMPSADWTAFVVAQRADLANRYMFGAVTGSTPGSSLHCGYRSSTVATIGFWGDDFDFGCVGDLAARLHVFLRKGGAGRKIRQDVVFGTGTPGTLSAIAGGGVLGGATGVFFKGYIFEVLMYDAAISVADQNTNLAYLRGRYPSLGADQF